MIGRSGAANFRSASSINHGPSFFLSERLEKRWSFNGAVQLNSAALR